MASQESLDFGDYIHPKLVKIAKNIQFESDGYTSSAKWFYDLYRHLEEPAPVEILSYFEWAWADMERQPPTLILSTEYSVGLLIA